MSIPTHCTKWPSSGRLGLGNQECMASPQPVAVSEDIRPCSVYCGVDCSVILTLDGTLLCCGNNRWDTLTASLIDLLLCYTDDRWHTDWLTYGLTAPLYWWWVAHWLSHVLTYCSVILMLDDTRMLWLWCGLLFYTDAGWHSVCCDCGVDCSVILMLDGTLCAVTGVDCSVILMLDDTLCTVTVVWTPPLYWCWVAHCVLWQVWTAPLYWCWTVCCSAAETTGTCLLKIRTCFVAA